MKNHLLAATSFALLGVVSSAQAITNGGPDGNAHPYVGIMVADDANGNPMWRCSGTLISPTVFLTAGHCTEAPAARATIWFEEDVSAGRPANGYPFGGPTSVDGTVYTHPNFYDGPFYLHDVGVVVLDTPVTMSTYGELPTEGQLDPLLNQRGLQDATFTVVGYGLQRSNPVFVENYLVRLKATVNLVTLRGLAGGAASAPDKTSVWLTANASTGGQCFGDSGGPQFADSTNVVVAVTSYGLNGNCAGLGAGYRIDQPDDLEFINSFLD
jgi:V8-like Glu-specific endopeptidase